MDVYPLSVSGPASAMLLAMGMTPILSLGIFISTVVCIVLYVAGFRNLRLQACHYIASQPGEAPKQSPCPSCISNEPARRYVYKHQLQTRIWWPAKSSLEKAGSPGPSVWVLDTNIVGQASTGICFGS